MNSKRLQASYIAGIREIIFPWTPYPATLLPY
jgi:hypothetical protein